MTPMTDQYQLGFEEGRIAAKHRWDQLSARNASLRGQIAGLNRALGKRNARIAELEAALATAADDLAKAANQFAGMREADRVSPGSTPRIKDNPEIFAEKERRARAVLAALDGGGTDAH